MSKIYAVLVGIDQYQKYPLSGCVNDIKAVERWLNKTYSHPGQLNLLRLTDEDQNNQPIRQNIINAFEHFDQAADNDICLFYYCGHGVNLKPPPELSHEPALQGFVCKDWAAADDGKGFLVDKEIAYLVWQKTQNKPNMTFLLVTDCCHSGTITRDLDEVEEQDVRAIAGTFKSPLFSEFVGYQSNGGYQTDEAQKPVVLTGRQIHFAAAQDDQKAYEIITPANEKRGGFTYYLIDVLEKFAGQVTYQEIFDYVGRSIRNYFISANKTKQQFPCFSVLGTAKNEGIANHIFFTSNQKKIKHRIELYFDPRTGSTGWHLDAGQVEGLTAGDFFRVQSGDESTLTVKAGKVFRDYAFVSDEISTLDKTQRYTVIAAKPLQSALVLYFDESVPRDFQQPIIAEWDKAFGDDPFITVVFETAATIPPSAPFLKIHEGTIHLEYKDNTFWLCEQFNHLNETKNKSQWDLFLDNLAKAANWVRLVKYRNNVVTKDQALPYQIQLKCTSGVDEKGEPRFVDRDPDARQVMNYLEGGQQPAFQLAVHNTHTDTLFVSFAYLAADGSIDTSVFTWLTVEAGKTAAMAHEGISIIPLAYEPAANDNHPYTTDYVKVFISKTKLIPLGAFEQKALAKQSDFASRALAIKKVDAGLETFDWQAETICFSIQRKLS